MENSERDESRSWENQGSMLSTFKFKVFISLPSRADGYGSELFSFAL